MNIEKINLEKVVLGELIYIKDSYYKVQHILNVNIFSLDRHNLIYQAITDLVNEGKPVDLISITHYLNSKNNLQNVGGALYLTELTESAITGDNIVYHAELVKKNYISKCIKELARNLLTIEDAHEAYTEAEAKLLEISKSYSSNSIQHISEVNTQVIKSIVEGVKDGLKVGFTLDDYYQFNKGHFIVYAARPAMGKTVKCLNIAVNLAKQGKKVLIFSLEMTAQELVKRINTAESSINHSIVKNNAFNPLEMDAYEKAISKVNDLPIYIDDTAAISVEDLRSKAKFLKAKYDIDFIIVDYLQLMTSKRTTDRYALITLVSQSCKQIAKEVEVPFLALSQLSRAVEQRPDKKPLLSDLRESGSIEQDADCVIFLYRPEYYGIIEDADGSSLKGLAFEIVAKNRHGKTGEYLQVFKGEFMKFENYLLN